MQVFATSIKMSLRIEGVWERWLVSDRRLAHIGERVDN
jgi:hypothetical protein